jgi:hypothetical protein
MKLKKVPTESAVFEQVSNYILYCRFSPDEEYEEWFAVDPCGSTYPYSQYPSIVCEREDGVRDVYFYDRSGRIYTYD